MQCKFVPTKKLFIFACLLLSFSATQTIATPNFWLKVPGKYKSVKAYSKDLYDLVQELVTKGSDDDLSGEFQVISRLLRKGANPASLIKRESEELDTVLHIAAESKKTQILKVILENTPEIESKINVKDENDMTPLHAALWIHDARRGMEESEKIQWRKENVKLLLAFGADPNLQERFGHSSLMLAVCCNWPLDIIELLIEKKADPDTQTTNGYAPLHYLMHHNGKDYQTAKVLLEAGGANPKIEDNEGYAPIHFAVRYKAYPTIKLLLRHNAEPLQRNKQDETPLSQLGFEAESYSSPYVSRADECRSQGFNEKELSALYEITRMLFPSHAQWLLKNDGNEEF